MSVSWVATNASDDSVKRNELSNVPEDMGRYPSFKRLETGSSPAQAENDERGGFPAFRGAVELDFAISQGKERQCGRGGQFGVGRRGDQKSDHLHAPPQIGPGSHRRCCRRPGPRIRYPS